MKRTNWPRAVLMLNIFSLVLGVLTVAKERILLGFTIIIVSMCLIYYSIGEMGR